MDTNGHLASVGSASDKAAYEHGVQVIDENKEFKYVFFYYYYFFFSLYTPLFACLLDVCVSKDTTPPPIRCLA